MSPSSGSTGARPRLPALHPTAPGNPTRNKVGLNLNQTLYAGAGGALSRQDGGRRGLFGVGEIIGVLTNVSQQTHIRELGSGDGILQLTSLRLPAAADRGIAELDRVQEDAGGSSARAQGGSGTRAKYVCPMPLAALAGLT